MLSLRSKTSPEWLARVEASLEEILLDHAHCEKKAAGTAVNLIFSYGDQSEFAMRLSDIAREELEHFRLVLELLERRGIAYRRQKPSSYGARLAEHVRKTEPEKIIDRCLIAALIEARSCERFAVLRDGLRDQELARFYGELFESEARHHATYVQFAKRYGPDEVVEARLEELAQAEREIVAQGDPFPRLHS